MIFKELREKSGMSRSGFAKFFAIPYRTVQNWELGLRECPVYLLDLLEIALDKIPQKPVEKFPFEVCPRCDSPVHKGMKFCSECGLALDWSDFYVKIPQNFDGDLKNEVENQLMKAHRESNLLYMKQMLKCNEEGKKKHPRPKHKKEETQ